MYLKKLKEEHAKIINQMKEMSNTLKTEERAFTEEELKAFDELAEKAEDLKATIARLMAMKDEDEILKDDEKIDDAKEAEGRTLEASTEEIERRSFEAFIRGAAYETRDGDPEPTTMNKGDNGAVIPQTIAQKIISKVYDICPIYKDAERYNVKGTLSIPYYDETTDSIKCDYIDEFESADSHSGKFGSITLNGFLASALCDVSKSLVNNSQFDIVGYVVDKMAFAISRFLEKELLLGTDDKIDGLAAGIVAGNIFETDTQSTISGDTLIDLQESIPDEFQAGAYFIMNRKTRAKIRKIKDGNGVYLLNRDLDARWGYTLLGKDVYCSDVLPEIKAANAGDFCIFYGDMSGLACKVSEEMEVAVLREINYTKHVITVCGFVECDAKVQDAQKLAGIKVKAS